MFDALDAVLAELVAPAVPDGVQIGFATPDQDFARSVTSLPALSVFLYDVGENTGLHGSRWEVREDADHVHRQRRAPIRVDCSYLITAWTDAGARTTRDEHLILGAVTRELLRHRYLPADLVRAHGLGDQPFPIPARVLGSDHHLHSVGQFWQAMGGRPKATLHYGVTLAVEVSEPPSGRKITQKPAVTLSTNGPPAPELPDPEPAEPTVAP